MDWTQVLIAVLTIIVPPLLAAVALQLRSLYAAKTTAEVRFIIENVVRAAVQAAEQTGLAQQWLNAGAEKKALAIATVQHQLDALHIPVDVAIIESLVESMVYSEIN